MGTTGKKVKLIVSLKVLDPFSSYFLQRQDFYCTKSALFRHLIV